MKGIRAEQTILIVLSTRWILYIFLCIPSFCNAQIIRHPSHLYRSGNSVEVVRIEYAPEATLLTFKTTKECVPILKVNHGIFIVDDNGKRHYATGTDGIKLDSLYVMAKGQPRKFSIAFDPVSENNQALDVSGGNISSIYGLHDARRGLTIPKASREVDRNEIDTDRFATDWVEIDGIVHDDSHKNGTIYANYYSERPYLNEDKHRKYSRIDENGRFHMRFLMYSPTEVQLSMSEFGGEWFGNTYLRPGDKVHVDVYGDGSHMSIASGNQAGYPAYNNLMNVPVLTPEASWICNQLNKETFDVGTYAHCMSRANDGYAKALELADYVCWHYNLSPFEAELYFERIRTQYTNSFTILALRGESAGDSVDYSYIGGIDPDDVTFSLINTGTYMSDMIVLLKPFRKCHQLVSDNDPDRWLKVINLQRLEFERLTDKSGFPFLFQMMVAADYHSVFDWKPADEAQFQKVRELLTHTYCKKRLDIMHKELKSKSQAR